MCAFSKFVVLELLIIFWLSDCSYTHKLWEHDWLQCVPVGERFIVWASSCIFVFELRPESESTAVVVLWGLRQDLLSSVVIDVDTITYCINLKNCSFNHCLSRLSSKNIFYCMLDIRNNGSLQIHMIVNVFYILFIRMLLPKPARSGLLWSLWAVSE